MPVARFFVLAFALVFALAGDAAAQQRKPAPGTLGAECGRRLPSCRGGLYCQYADQAACGRTGRPGTCQAAPRACTREYRPVCSCDLQTYSNRCVAYSLAKSVMIEGRCR